MNSDSPYPRLIYIDLHVTDFPFLSQTVLPYSWFALQGNFDWVPHPQLTARGGNWCKVGAGEQGSHLKTLVTVSFHKHSHFSVQSHAGQSWPSPQMLWIPTRVQWTLLCSSSLPMSLDLGIWLGCLPCSFMFCSSLLQFCNSPLPTPNRRGVAARYISQQVVWATCSHWPFESGPLCHCALLHWLGACLQNMHVLGEAAPVVQFNLSFLCFLVDCQRPWGLISHLWVPFPPQDLPICCISSCPGKTMLASLPLPKILQCLFWFLQIVLALTPCTATTDSWLCWSPLSDSKVLIIFCSLQLCTDTFAL